MINCIQSGKQNILEHGLSVCDYLFDLINQLNDTYYVPKYTWKLPNWLTQNLYQKYKHMVFDDKTLKLYTIYHDCGKPFCQTIDDKGRHFYNHVVYSHQYFKQVFDNEVSSTLILHDMDIHIFKPSQIKDFFTSNYENAFVLLLTGIAEIHSNSNMFGGLESTSFKIKWKHLDKMGIKLIELLDKT